MSLSTMSLSDNFFLMDLLMLDDFDVERLIHDNVADILILMATMNEYEDRKRTER
jgi:hypothetical protein